MKCPFFSVIIPVYNVEKFIRECVSSVLSQSFTDFEVILIDDGSKDDSPKICDEYAENDSRVKVIHKANGGVSSARNVGLNNAAGEYILFCDSDDYYTDGAFDAIFKALEGDKVDILNYGYIKEKSAEGETENNVPAAVCGKIDDELLIKTAFCSYWRNVDFFIEIVTHAFKRSMLTENNVFFDEKLTKAEDNTFTLTAFANAKTTKNIQECLYFYRFNENSCINTWAYSEKSVHNSIRFLNNIQKILSGKGIGEEKYLGYMGKSLYRVALNPCIANAKLKGKGRRKYLKDVLSWYETAMECTPVILAGSKGLLNKVEMFMVKHKLIFMIDLHTRILAFYENLRGNI